MVQPGSSFRIVVGRAALEDAVVPLAQVVGDDGPVGQAGDPAGLERPRERTAVHGRESLVVQALAEPSGLLDAGLGQRDVGPAGVTAPTRTTPSRRGG